MLYYSNGNRKVKHKVINDNQFIDHETEYYSLILTPLFWFVGGGGWLERLVETCF